jgi:hypothetical protein
MQGQRAAKPHTVLAKAPGGLKKKSSAGAWKSKWEHKLAPENYFPLPEKYSETGFERLTMSN